MFPLCQNNRLAMSVKISAGCGRSTSDAAPGWRAGRGQAPRGSSLLDMHFFMKALARLALQMLVIGAELARRHLVFRRDRIGRRRRQHGRQHRGSDGVAKHGDPLLYDLPS